MAGMTTRMQLLAVLPSRGVEGGRIRTAGPDLRPSRH